jgi:creatinine amidohydrolase/Fe(II)-dependent formamide hydrolase-like protein
MGLRGKLRRLEDRAQAIAAETQEDEKLGRERAIMRMIVDEFARLKASGELSDADPLAQAVGNVAAAQYAELGEESCEYIADGWIETLREWTRLDWMVKAGRNGAPHA